MEHEIQVIRWLFASEAFKVSAAETPFWYTSGKFGPYYINTHYLFGSASEANDLLQLIENASTCPLALPHLIAKQCLLQYYQSESYKFVIDLALERIAKLEFDYISGGERRDFFFSFILAQLCKKPHLSILKNTRLYLSSPGQERCHEVKNLELKGAVVLHVADLVTEASSYFRAWLPALEFAGARISDTFAIVDRDQGGRAALKARHIELHNLCTINQSFFDLAEKQALIDLEQKRQLLAFTADPERYITFFLQEHPSFLQAQEQVDAKTRERVQRLRAQLAQ